MKAIDLGGHWTVFKKDSREGIPAAVPGCIHTDLMTQGEIADPYFRDNERSLFWIGETDWLYVRDFEVDSVLLSYDRVILQCLGLDTLAEIRVNGRKVGTADNQFRTWEYDVKRVLYEGVNHIEVLFRSPLPVIRSKMRRRPLAPLNDSLDRIAGGNLLRKSQCNFGWDWGPKCITCGIWRPIRIVGWDTARIRDVRIRQIHDDGVTVKVDVFTELRGAGRLSAEVVIRDVSGRSAGRRGPNGGWSVPGPAGGVEVVRGKAALRKEKASMSLRIDDPKLWWPNKLGPQPLYDVTVDLVEEREGGFLESVVLDTVTKRIGLRTLRLVQEEDAWGRSFAFEVNGKRFFAKGANWIPADTFVTRIAAPRYEALIAGAADANMNMLRVWGGGIYESDMFYELCDRYGICVWQDFMFACSAYPAFDPKFMENVRREVEEQVARLRHHPCIALWCGNNELEQIDWIIGKEAGQMTWPEYRSLFDRLIPAVLRREDPDRDYIPSSPHSPCGDRADYNSPRCGDAHLWDVWHGGKPFEWYRTCEHRFNSEFGFQSFPEPSVVEGYTDPEDRNITSYVMELHQRSGIGNAAIIGYMLDWFRLPSRCEMTLWLSQILQGMAIKYAVEHWRRKMPQGMGTLYWQLNDCWPVASWSSIDFAGNWKALHYMARRFYAPLLVSSVEDAVRGIVEIHVTSDLPDRRLGTVSCDLTDTNGVRIRKEEVDVKIASGKNRRVMKVDLGEELAEYGRRRLMLWVELRVDGKRVSSNLAILARPKYLELRDPEIKSTIKQLAGGGFAVTLRSKHPALWVWPELRGAGAAFSDRFFHIPPFQWRRVTIRPEKSMTLARFQKLLRINSLTDTYAG